MLKRYLVVISKKYGAISKDEVEFLEQEAEVKGLVGRIAAGNFGCMEEEQTLKDIYEVDLDYGKMKRLVPTLENMKIVLKEAD